MAKTLQVRVDEELIKMIERIQEHYAKYTGIELKTSSVLRIGIIGEYSRILDNEKADEAKSEKTHSYGSGWGSEGWAKRKQKLEGEE